MLATQTYSRTGCPARLLRPADVIKRFRPATIDAIASTLYPHHHRVQGLKLIRRFFPELLLDVIPLASWLEVMNYFLHCVADQGWFQIDWDTIEMLWQWANNDYPNSEEEEEDPYWEPEAFDLMGEALEWIPVKAFGYDDIGFNSPDISEHPPMLLLNALLQEGGFQMDKREWEFLAGVTVPSKAKCRGNLKKLDVSTLPPPLCWLKEMAGIACADTGNPILDRSCTYENWGQWHDWYTWDEVDRCKADWQAAQPVLERRDQFLAWADSEIELEIIFNLITATPSRKLAVIFTPGGNNVPERKSSKRKRR